MRKWLLLALLLFPAIALASSQGGLFSVSSSDKSMEYLGMALGTIPGTPIQSTGSPLVGSMIYIFNQVIFVLGILIVVYTTIVGTMNTAQEGEFLGKNWHPILVPLRAALGIYLLLPSTTGYNWIQMTVMWFIVQGVGAANSLWNQVITFNQSQGSVHTDTRSVNLQNSGGTVSAIFNANVCMITLNDNATAQSILNEPITVYRWGDKIEWGRLSQAGREQPLCGSIQLPSVGGALNSSSNPDVAARKDAFSAAVMQAQATLLGPAEEAIYGGGTTSLGAAAFTSAANLLQTTAQNMSTTFESLDSINQQAVSNGWIHAGSYYFQLVQGSAGPGVSVNLGASGPNVSQINTLLGSTLGSQLISLASAEANTYSNQASQNITTSTASENEGKLELSDTATDPNVQSIMASIFGTMLDQLVNDINTQMTAGQDDPIISMATFGANITSAVELTFWTALGLIFVSWLVTAVLSCLNPLGHAMNFLLSMFIPIAIIVLSLLYATGIVLALYIPLIPYLVFTFCAIGWIILVIEALLGSSLIALTLVVPSEDEIGKAGHAMVILLGLFLRPALMILGFIFAIQLLIVAVKMLNFGFWETLIASTGASSGIGIFGMVAVFLMYSAIATAMTHEAFSLIYLLPNKVLRWMGGSPEGEEDVMSKVKEQKGSVEKGGAIGKAGMSGVLTKFAPKG